MQEEPETGQIRASVEILREVRAIAGALGYTHREAADEALRGWIEEHRDRATSALKGN